MLIVMKNDATEEQIRAVIKEIESMGYRGIPMPGAQRTAVCIIGNKGAVDNSRLLALEGVKETIPVTKPYKLVSRETQPESTVTSLLTPAVPGAQPLRQPPRKPIKKIPRVPPLFFDFERKKTTTVKEQGYQAQALRQATKKKKAK